MSTVKIRLVVDLELSEEKIREHYSDSAAVMYIHVLRGGAIDPATRARYPTSEDFTRKGVLKRLAWDALLGGDNHGADITDSMSQSVEELSPKTIREDEFCPVCQHYPGEHTVEGCQGTITTFFSPESSASDNCPCTVPGPLVLRHDRNHHTERDPLRVYAREISKHAHVIPVKEWLEAVQNGSFVPYDGMGRWAKDGKESEDYNIFHGKPEDATHVAWYNK